MQPNFFDEHSPFLSHPLLTDERTAVEADFAVAQLGLAAGDAVLDVGCGFGRHAVALAQRGFAVTAVDPAPAMIARGQQLAEAAHVAVNFVTAPMEQMRFVQQFEGAICLFTTLGQVSNGNDNVSLLNGVHRALNQGGRLMVEVPQRETAVSTLKPDDEFSSPSQRTRIERSYDPATQRVTEQFQIETDTTRRRFLLQYRLFSANELDAMLTQAGFTSVARFANYNGELLTPDSPTMIFVAKK